ncbi:hypothetical protein QCA50_000561 [Cerrena zonata]|uniref:CID domain-containing protein n=1 Tax=Cerrena zonata TaxID=2478898 RepID=A0AAW0GZ89_9APHY
MALYPQSQVYAQPQYPTGYPQQPIPPPAPNHFYPPTQPQSQPFFHVDPDTFRRDYMNRLAELTVNSRPIIHNLSIIAQESKRYAQIVAQCIESHIRRVPNWMKLPAFYLLDSISKNVFDPYARQFTPLVVRLFLDTYEGVDQATRSKMEEMLLTWRTGSPDNRELFGVVSQLAIERQIWGSGSQSGASSLKQNGQSGVSQAQVVSELDFVLGQKERALQSNPYDKVSQQHVAILHQLRSLVQAGVSQSELGAILNQLRTLAPAPTPAPARMPPPSVALPPARYPPPQHLPPPSALASTPSVPSYPVPAFSQPKVEPTAANLASSSSAPPVPVPNISNLFNALMKAGVVSANATPTGAGQTAKDQTPPPADSPKDALREYRKAIVSARIRLGSSDIMRQRPPIVRFLYDTAPSQCKQCGIRFSDSSSGKKRMEDHLDMHFRQNRKSTQSSGRGHCRSLFVNVEDWISYGSSDAKGKGRADGLVNAKAMAAAEAAKADADLRAMYVVVPPGDEAQSMSCPICKESLKAEFLEDDEEWVWRNAIIKDDKVFHATCHAEASASKSSLAARLRNEVSSRSRSRSQTPEAQMKDVSHRKSESPTPKLAGNKRKAEDDGHIFHGTKQEEGTPPMKKLALTA